MAVFTSLYTRAHHAICGKPADGYFYQKGCDFYTAPMWHKPSHFISGMVDYLTPPAAVQDVCDAILFGAEFKLFSCESRVENAVSDTAFVLKCFSLPEKLRNFLNPNNLREQTISKDNDWFSLNLLKAKQLAEVVQTTVEVSLYTIKNMGLWKVSEAVCEKMEKGLLGASFVSSLYTLYEGSVNFGAIDPKDYFVVKWAVVSDIFKGLAGLGLVGLTFIEQYPIIVFSPSTAAILLLVCTTVTVATPILRHMMDKVCEQERQYVLSTPNHKESEQQHHDQQDEV